MFVISFNICLFIYFSVKYAIQSNDCDVFVNKQSIYLSIYLHCFIAEFFSLHLLSALAKMPSVFFLDEFSC